MKVETVYTMPYETEADIREAKELRSNLYDKFNNVQIYPNGLYEVRIIATDPILISELAAS